MADAEVVRPKTEDEVQRELAIRDLGDIHALRKSVAFDRYFLRRLREKIAPLQEAILEDDKLTDEQRNQKRREMKIYREILGLLDADEIGNRSIAEM